MSIFDTLFSGIEIDSSSTSSTFSSDSSSIFESTAINPANGLPMVDGIGSVDVMGNPFGMDYSTSSSCSSLDD